jgi:hypothetical protein
MDYHMNLAPKEVRCSCGHSFETNCKADYCSKCGRKIFYDDKQNRQHRLNSYYFGAIVLIVATFLVYIYIELIASPLLQP